MGIFKMLFTPRSAVAAEELPQHATLIDVRSPAEFAAGHIEGAIMLPLNRVARDIGAAVPDKATPVVVYCRSGARSASARQQLLDMGYRQVINGGGLHALASRMHRKILR